VEACLGRQRRDGAAVVGGDGAARVADQEGEVEFAEQSGRDDRWVGRGVAATGIAVGGCPVGVGGAVDRLGLIGAGERGNNVGGLAVRREEVVGDVLDEETLALCGVSYLVVSSPICR
jgi:hypothetical protein